MNWGLCVAVLFSKVQYMETTTARRNVQGLVDIRIGEIIRANRKLRDMTLDQLGTAVGLTHGAIKNYESGRRTVTRERAHALADVLGIPPRLLNPDAA